MGGFAVSASRLGLPDTGLISYAEMVDQGRNICSSVSIPVLGDGDTGYGNALNVKRTVQGYAAAGFACVMIEDQVSPKRCGHTRGKLVVERDESFNRIKAAVDARLDEDFVIMARTDALAVEGLQSAIDRAAACAEAGADMIFPEALANEKEFEAVRSAIKVPLLANMTEFGKSRLLNRKELENLGYNMVIYPVTTLRLAMGEVDRGLEAILNDGDQTAILDRMQHRKDLYDLLRYEEYNRYDRDLFNFRVGDNPP